MTTRRDLLMREMSKRALAWAVAAVVVGVGTPVAAGAQEGAKGNLVSLSAEEVGQLEQLLPKVRGWKLGEKGDAIEKVAGIVAKAQRDPNRQGEVAAKLAQAAEGEGTVEGKEFLYRQLAMVATKAEVPAAAKLLGDPKWAHMGRYVLEGIKDPAAGAALLKALGEVRGKKNLIGIISSMGARRDLAVVDALASWLQHPDPEIAVAVAVALGDIGGEAAWKALAAEKATAREVQEAIADARLRVADGMLKAGKKAEAAAAYEELSKGNGGAQVEVAALRGLVEARPEKALPVVIEALKGSDAEVAAVAAELGRQIPGDEATRQLVAVMHSLPAGAKAAVVQALGRRGDVAARGAVTAAVKSEDEAVRVAAVGALGSLGDEKSVAVLAEVIAKGSAAERDAAREALGRVKGEAADRAVLAYVRSAGPAEVRAELVKVLARRTRAVVPQLLEVAKSDGAEPVRIAALGAVGQLAGEGELPALLERVAEAKSDAERNAARDALASAANRVGQREASAKLIIEAMSSATTATKVALLGALSRVGGEAALNAVKQQMSSGEGPVKEAATRALTDWQDTSAVDDLIALAQSENPTYRVLALRGLVRVMNLPNERKANETLEVYKRAMAVAGTPEQKRLVLAGVGDVKDAAALELVLPALEDPALKSEAAAAVVKIAGNVRNARGRDALQKVVDSDANEGIKRRAKEMLEQQSRRQ